VAGLVVLTVGLANPWEPSYPPVLNWLPLLGSLSVCLTLAWLAVLIYQWRSLRGLRKTRIAWMLFAVCAIAFVPYVGYWNALGLSLH
jgi:hypothetical protein